MAANSGIEKLKGTWEYVDGEHFDDYMKEIGVGFALRQSAKLVKPKLIISERDGRWTLKSESTLKSGSYEFTPGMEFDETRLDGESVKSTIRFENDKWVHTMRDKHGKESTVTRWVDAQGQQQIDMRAGDVTARRWYRRAD
jgi:fatty acid-binding protein 3